MTSTRGSRKHQNGQPVQRLCWGNVFRVQTWWLRERQGRSQLCGGCLSLPKVTSEGHWQYDIEKSQESISHLYYWFSNLILHHLIHGCLLRQHMSFFLVHNMSIFVFVVYLTNHRVAVYLYWGFNWSTVASHHFWQAAETLSPNKWEKTSRANWRFGGLK